MKPLRQTAASSEQVADLAHPTKQVIEGILLTVAATFIWSTVPICVKVILTAFDPFTIALLRFILATAILSLVMYKAGHRKLDRADKLWIALGGLGMMSNYTLYNIALQHTTASAANLIVQVEVVALILLGKIVLKEHIGRLKQCGIFLTIVGVSLVFYSRGSFEAAAQSRYLIGNLIMLAAGIMWSFYGLAHKALSNRGAPVAQALVGIFGIAALFSAMPTAVMYQQRGPITPLVVLCIVIIGVFSTGIAYLLIGRAFRLVDASTVAATTALLPVFTIFMARIFLKETLTFWLLAGAALVVSGILVMARQDVASGGESNAG